MDINLNDYNLTIPEHIMDPEYSFDIQKRFERNIPKVLKKELEGEENWKYMIQPAIDSFKREVIYFTVDEIINETTYRGTVIKEGGTTHRPLGTKHYFRWDNKLIDGEIVGMLDNLYIHEHLKDVESSTPPLVNVKSEFKNPLEDETESVGLNPQTESIETDDTDIDNFMEVMQLVSQLYKMDKKYLLNKLVKLSGEMKLHNSLKLEPNKSNILKALSFYDHMRSDLDIKTTVNKKARDTHSNSVSKSAAYYEIEEQQLQKWIGKRNSFLNSKINKSKK